MMRSVLGWSAGLLLCWVGMAAGRIEGAHPQAAETVVVANSADPDSVAIAEAYQAFRGIPDENVIRLSLPTALELTREVFTEKVFNPLREELLRRDLFDGDFVGPPDALGRKPLIVWNNKVRYLVLCRGVPLKVREGGKEADAPILETYLRGVRRSMGNRNFAWPAAMAKTRASVDSELALLAENNWPITAVVANPLYQEAPGSRATSILRVTRLDGPSTETLLRSFETMRAVEENGLKGRAYFDTRSIKQGVYKLGDDWIGEAAEATRAAYFDTDENTRGGVFGVGERMDAAAIYVGWYSGQVAGPFTLEDFRMAPGAIAFHLHSFSASNPRNPSRHWVGPLLEAGAVATVGNVYEPYLNHTHHLGRLTRFLLEGNNLGDAAFASIPTLSWQSVVFGDPLYEPFKVSLAEMLPPARRMEDPTLDPYVILREMNRLIATGDAEAARALGLAMQTENPHPALALRLARDSLAADEAGAALRAKLWLRPFAAEKEIPASDWVLFVEIARELAGLEESEAATSIFRHLLAFEPKSRDLEKILLREGSAAALWNHPDESAAWKARYEAILEQERREKEEAEARKRAEEEAKAKAAAEASNGAP